jgi:hypothetical protein
MIWWKDETGKQWHLEKDGSRRPGRVCLLFRCPLSPSGAPSLDYSSTMCICLHTSDKLCLDASEYWGMHYFLYSVVVVVVGGPFVAYNLQRNQNSTREKEIHQSGKGTWGSGLGRDIFFCLFPFFKTQLYWHKNLLGWKLSLVHIIRED